MSREGLGIFYSAWKERLIIGTEFTATTPGLQVTLFAAGLRVIPVVLLAACARLLLCRCKLAMTR
jgi:hypothetical protein